MAKAQENMMEKIFAAMLAVFAMTQSSGAEEWDITKDFAKQGFVISMAEFAWLDRMCGRYQISENATENLFEFAGLLSEDTERGGGDITTHTYLPAPTPLTSFLV